MPITKDKRKFALWLYPETLERIKQLYAEDDCRSKSEFIEKAVQFYIDHLTAADDRSMLPNAMLSSMKSIVAESDNRLSRLLFKLAVELAADHGNNYAAQLLHSIRVNGNFAAALATLRLLGHTARIIQNRLEDERCSRQGSIDRKLRRKNEEKKQAQGLKQ